MGKVILLTGAPGSGKTTAIKRIVALLSRPAGGFYTEEIREQGARTGFKIVTLDGREGVLARIHDLSRFLVGRYGVNVAAVDSLAVDSIRQAIANRALVVIDEIGPMEAFSPAFREAVLDALASDAPVLGAIVKRPHPFADQVKALPGVTLIEVTIVNRDNIVDDVLERLRKG